LTEQAAHLPPEGKPSDLNNLNLNVTDECHGANKKIQSSAVIAGVLQDGTNKKAR